MVKIRLRRVGAKRQPYFRVVVADTRSPRDGRFIEIIGHYDPRQDPPAFTLKEDRAIYWLQQGAQASEAVARMFDKLGTLDKLARVRAGESVADVLAEAAVAAAVQVKPVEPSLPEEAEEEAVVEETAEPISVVSLEELGLSPRVLKALGEAKVHTVQDLLDKLAQGREEVLAIAGLGRKSLEEIEEALRAAGLLE
ncbi:MAG: 30S ribosomal protein S16 [Anaerolineae bacterium]|nr:30S ribosomal protein S16 [Anaerolineae bacterium]